MPTVSTPYGEIYYAQVSPPKAHPVPLLLIHGAGGSHLVWPKELRRLEGYRVLALDLPGHGRSNGDGLQDVEAYAKAVHTAARHLSLEPYVAIGHSMGGAIAQTLALEAPQHLAGMVLMGTGPQLPVNAVIINDISQEPERVTALINKWAWGPHAPYDLRQQALTLMQTVPHEVIRGDYIACNRFNVTPQLKNISVPTLVIGGTLDKMTPFRMSKTLAQQIPNAELVKIEQGGHFMLLEHPKKTAHAVTRWLRKAL